MKVVDLIVTVCMVLLGLGLTAAYAGEGNALFATVWAFLAAVNAASATLRGVTIAMESGQ